MAIEIDKTNVGGIGGTGDGIKTINGTSPDPSGNINVATMTDAERAQLTKALEMEPKLSELEDTIGKYSERTPLTLVAKESNVAINRDGAKVSKSGWAIAEFLADKGNEYLFNPGTMDGDVCIFAEEIIKQETRSVNYTYQYDEDGYPTKASATYNGQTHTYTYSYERDAEGNVTGETITDDQTGQAVSTLPYQYKAEVGTYLPLTVLNANAELPRDGYCRFISHFQGSGQLKVAVSYNIATANKTLKVIRDGYTANLATQLGYLSQKIDESNNVLALTEAKAKDAEYKLSVLGENLEESLVYGVVVDESQSSPDLQRVGNLALHKSLPIQNRMRRCLLLDNGSVNYYLDANDSTKKEDGTAANLDGTDGQVMVEIPKHYRRLKMISESAYRVDISFYPFKDAVEVPLMYVSAWEATVDRSNGNKLSSVVNTDARYRGGNNQTAWDGTYRSVLGKPATAISLTNIRTYARKRGEGWNCYEYRAHIAIFWMYAIEYATLNSQATFNAALSAEGYHQGGLGAGVTDIADAKWSAYNGYNPFIPCGYTAELGNNTGVVAFSWDEEQQAAYGAAWTTNVPSYRGIENPFGHIFKWTDGVMFDIHADSDSGESFACKPSDTSEYGDTSKYVPFGNIPRASGFAKWAIISEYADIIPRDAEGGSTIYFCDRFYTSLPTSGNSWRGLCLGGYAYSGAHAGLACSASNYAASTTSASVGSRLCFCSTTKL